MPRQSLGDLRRPLTASVLGRGPLAAKALYRVEYNDWELKTRTGHRVVIGRRKPVPSLNFEQARRCPAIAPRTGLDKLDANTIVQRVFLAHP